MIENTQPTKPEELTEEDLQAIAASLGEGEEVQPLDYTILKVWKEILSNIEAGQAERISPVVANNILSQWQRLNFGDLQLYWELYHRVLAGYREVFHEILKANPDAIDQVENDATENRAVYFEIIKEWTRYARAQETEWDVSDRHAGVKLAAMLDASKFFFGPMGIIQQLLQPQVGFEWDEADQIALEDALSAEETEEATGE